MSAYHFRYSWIAATELKKCFPESSAIATIIRHMALRRSLIPLAQGSFPQRSALASIMRWMLRPIFSNWPKRSLIRKAREQASIEQQSCVKWVEEAVAMIQRSQLPASPPYDEMLFFLRHLSHTDFPCLLAWSQPELARRLFRISETGQVELQDSAVLRKRSLAQSTHTCLGYALAGIAHLAPRQAWIGVGFGVCADPASDDPVSIVRDDERIWVDPDLGWIDRHWVDLQPMAMEAGQSAWDYLHKRIEIQTDVSIKDACTDRYTQLHDICAALQRQPWDLRVVLRGLGQADELLRQTTTAEDWQRDPHRFWISRIYPVEVITGKALRQFLYGVLEHHLQWYKLKNLVNDKTIPQGVRLPYPEMLISETEPEFVVMADEYFDWTIGFLEHQDFRRPWFSGYWQNDAGHVFRFAQGLWQFSYIDPNPRRAAERFAVRMQQRPTYCRQHNTIRALRPPVSLVDNRLIRLMEPEIDASDCRVGDNVMFYSTLLCQTTQPLFQLEVSSPIYQSSADILPRMIDAHTRQEVSFGAIYGAHAMWMLDLSGIYALRNKVHSAERLALVYFLEVHEMLGNPDWLTLQTRGKRLVVPVRSLLAFDYLIHLFRIAQEAVLIFCDQGKSHTEWVVDGQGCALNMQIIMQ